jgi:hypothetical protein
MTVALPRIHQDWSALIGFVLLASPLAFLTIAVQEHYLGITLFMPFMDWMSSPTMNLISPIVFLGGLTAALALNIYALLGIHVRKEGGTFVSTIAMTPRTWNLAVVLLSGLVLTIMLGYAIVENIGHA